MTRATEFCYIVDKRAMTRDGAGKLKGRRNHRWGVLDLVDQSNIHFLDRYTRRAIAENTLRERRHANRIKFEEMVMGRTLEEFPFI